MHPKPAKPEQTVPFWIEQKKKNNKPRNTQLL